MIQNHRARVAAALVCGAVGLAASSAVAQPLGDFIQFERVTGGLSQPLYLTTAPGEQDVLYVVQKGGQIRTITDGTLDPDPFLDLSALVSTQSERGLLGLAFHPDYENNALFYVNYTEAGGDTIVAEFTDSDVPEGIDPTSGRTVISIDQPESNHNGGWLGFGPDGYLYIAVGDGGSGNDPDNHAQDTEDLLGTILRIDPTSGAQYGIPADNPFVGAPGRDEIWAYGLRNPWRNSFDRETGDFWIADVGQGEREEINFQPADSMGGENYGWRCFEGMIRTPVYQNNAECLALMGTTPPLFDYTHSQGISITGGYVYRGCAIPQLRGKYIYGDFGFGTIWALSPVVNLNDGTVSVGGNEVIGSSSSLSSFGEDANGELYVIELGPGTIYKLVPGISSCNPADLAAPYGTLNFADVQFFLGAFGEGTDDPCGVADFAAPFGVYNFADVQAFLGAFGNGCP